MTCPSLETVAAWVLGELDEASGQHFEEHYFGCDLCLGRAEQLKRLALLMRASLPPVLTVERRRELEALHPQMPVVNVQPGDRAVIQLGPRAEVGMWVMHAPLAQATRVDLEAHGPPGRVLFSFRDVPFDATRGEVVLPCHLHYRAVSGGAEMYVRLTATEPDGRHPVVDYILDHEFESL